MVEIVPKLAEPACTPRAGFPKFAWFKISKKSALNTRRVFSVILVPFETEKSVLLNPGPVIAFRPRLPKWNTPDGLTGTANVAPVQGPVRGSQILALANHCCGSPVITIGPRTSGLSVPFPVKLFAPIAFTNRFSGLPVWTWVIPDNCQP